MAVLDRFARQYIRGRPEDRGGFPRPAPLTAPISSFSFNTVIVKKV